MRLAIPAKFLRNLMRIHIVYTLILFALVNISAQLKLNCKRKHNRMPSKEDQCCYFVLWELRNFINMAQI